MTTAIGGQSGLPYLKYLTTQRPILRFSESCIFKTNS